MFLKQLIFNRRFSIAASKKVFKMNRQSNTYEAAVETLNKLQTNAEYLKLAREKNLQSQQTAQALSQVKKYLRRIGLTLDKLDELSVIHIAGTKGKGSTCAFCESILRHHGYKTGFFSSPHLLEVRERIRINGKPISRDDFASNFFQVYEKLNELKDGPSDMPLYFRFLTILALQYFLRQKVDVAIIEVGIGGEYDCTNVLRKVPVVGITSLGIDHTSILGNTLEEIAWQKAGIMKKGCRAFTIPQPEEAMGILQSRSVEKECPLTVVEDRLHFTVDTTNGSPDTVFNKNASLAIALAQAWMKSRNINGKGLQELSPEIIKYSLSNCRWPGRYEIRNINNTRYFLDGAHTLDSIIICANWFKTMTENSSSKKALIFYVTGDRDAEKLLKELRKCNFDVVLFTPCISERVVNADNASIAPVDQQVNRSRKHKEIWLDLEKTDDTASKAKHIEAYCSAEEATDYLKNEKYDLLVTGSIHLIGCILNLIDPDINNNLYKTNKTNI